MTKTAYPKSKINVLLLENIHPEAVGSFETESYNVELLSASLPETKLIEKIKNVHVLGTRSKSKITENVLKRAKNLWAIGAYCIGTNHIDLNTCLDQGVAVFNAPYSNTRSVVELAIAEIIALMRQLTTKNQAMQQNAWQKSADNCFEIRGKKLGIIGYGNIGSQLSVLAEALGMQVYYYDTAEKLALGNARQCKSMAELLKISDVVSMHVDGRANNKSLIAEKEFQLMRKGSYFLNLSRGFVVDTAALARSLKSGHLAGAAVDVYLEEPHSNKEPFHHELQNIPNVILTPHIGGSTLEAQENIARFVTHHLISYINAGNSDMSVNFPEIKLPALTDAHRMIHIHRNVPGVLAYMNDLFASHNINIAGQYLKTNDKIGYVITDVSKQYDESLIQKIKQYEHTIKFRVLY